MSAMPASAPAAANALPLRDIHLPPAPSWWPPAPGWWLLAVLAVLALYFATRFVLRRWRARRWRARVHAALERIAASDAAQADPVRTATEVSRLLRRVSLVLAPGAAALQGEAWLEFLDARLPPAQAQAAPFRNGAGRLLLDLPYQPCATASQADSAVLLGLARSWLKAVLKSEPAHV